MRPAARLLAVTSLVEKRFAGMVPLGHQQRDEIVGLHLDALQSGGGLPFGQFDCFVGVRGLDEGVIGLRAAVVGVVGVKKQDREGFPL